MAFTRFALHGVKESFTSERFGPTLYSFDRQASAVFFYKHLKYWKDNDKDGSFDDKLTVEMYCCKALQE